MEIIIIIHQDRGGIYYCL